MASMTEILSLPSLLTRCSSLIEALFNDKDMAKYTRSSALSTARRQFALNFLLQKTSDPQILLDLLLFHCRTFLTVPIYNHLYAK